MNQIGNIIDGRGFFWWHNGPLPEHVICPDDRMSGTLKISADGRINLQLDGIMPNIGGRASIFERDESKLRGKIIQGHLVESSQYVTLLDLMVDGGSFRSHGISYQSYLASKCLLGNGHLQDAGALKHLKKLSINLKGLESWFPLNSKKINSDDRGLTVRYDNISDKVYDTDEGRITLRVILNPISYSVNEPHRLTLIETVFIDFKPAEDLTALEKLSEVYQIIQEFFIVMFGEYHAIDWPVVGTENEFQYTLYFQKIIKDQKEINFHDFPFLFFEVDAVFGTLFSNFYKRRNELGPGIYLFTGTKRSTSMFVQHRFISLVSCIETFDRRKNVSSPSKKLSLSDRLRRVLGSSLFKFHLDKLEVFIKRCVKIRNSISHDGDFYDVNVGIQAWLEIDQKNDALSFLLQEAILTEICLGHEIIQKSMTDGRYGFRCKNALFHAGLIENPNQQG